MKTTKAHFRLFQKQCEMWLDTFGLKAWEPYYLHESLSDIGEAVEAIAIYEATARNVTFYLNTDWNSEINDQAITRAAFHEVCELLLGKLNDLAKGRYVREDDIDEASHGVIRTLENVMLS